MPLYRYLLALVLGLSSLAPHAAERVTYYHNDALGSPIAATDEQGRVLWRKSYAPYGREFDGTAPKEPGYTGKLEEPGLGIQNFGARWYDPRIGPFLAIDPAGFDPQNPQSFNRYAYANNNPYKYVDPDGRAPKVPYQLNFDLSIGGGSYGMGYGRTSRAQAPSRTTGEGVAKAGGDAPKAARSIETPHGLAVQADSAAARAALQEVQSGATVYRQGSFGVQNTADAQFWSLRNPATTEGFANKMGMPGSAAKPDWIMGGTVRPGSAVTSRSAPGIGSNSGGDIEAVVPPGGVQNLWFHMPD
ncbi:MAG: RHS repeat domain-containing protein [Gammaproteobacteria bacterium]